MTSEDYFDLRAYAGLLAGSWRLILSTTVLGALLATGLSIRQPALFEATAVIVASRPLYAWQFDPRIGTSTDIKTVYAAYPELAVSDGLLRDLIDQLQPPSQARSITELRKMLRARLSTDQSSLQLTARSRDAKEAVRIANLWAELFVARFSPAGSDQIEQLARERDEAKARLAEAEQTQIDLAGRNATPVLEAKLSSARQDLADCLTERRALERLQASADELHTRLVSQPANTEPGMEDRWALLMLLAESYRLYVSSPGAAQVQPSGEPGLPDIGYPQPTSPVQLEVSGELLPAAKTTSSLIASLDRLQETIRARMRLVDSRSEALEPQILVLQRELEEARTQVENVERARSLAESTYTALAQKVEELRVAEHDAGEQVRLTRQAAEAKRAGLAAAPSAAVGGAFGFLVGLFAALTVAWWRAGAAVPPASAPA